MISNMSAFAPAGVLGSGSVVVRPYACADVRPALLGAVAGVEGLAVPTTGLPWAGTPAAGMAGRFRTTAPTGTGVDAQPIGTQHDPITQNDGTTLGIHPRGRSTS
jgi:hypothetical protein